ncbi:MAG: protein kinase domain-containing protein, partial [Bdellovibrionia bacterium]
KTNASVLNEIKNPTFIMGRMGICMKKKRLKPWIYSLSLSLSSGLVGCGKWIHQDGSIPPAEVEKKEKITAKSQVKSDESEKNPPTEIPITPESIHEKIDQVGFQVFGQSFKEAYLNSVQRAAKTFLTYQYKNISLPLSNSIVVQGTDPDSERSWVHSEVSLGAPSLSLNHQENLDVLMSSEFIESAYQKQLDGCPYWLPAQKEWQSVTQWSPTDGPHHQAILKTFVFEGSKRESVVYTLYCGLSYTDHQFMRFGYLIPHVVNGVHYYVGTQGTLKDHYWAFRFDSKESATKRLPLFQMTRPEGVMGGFEFSKEEHQQQAETLIEELVNQLPRWTGIRYSHSLRWSKEEKNQGILTNHTQESLLQGDSTKAGFLTRITEYGGMDLGTPGLIQSLELTQKVVCMQQILEQLKTLHSNQIYSRDIKPENVLFFEGSQVEGGASCALIDFGAAIWTPTRGRLIDAGLNFTPQYFPFLRAGNHGFFVKKTEFTDPLESSDETLKKQKEKLSERVDLFQTGYLLAYLMSTPKDKCSLQSEMDRLKGLRDSHLIQKTLTEGCWARELMKFDASSQFIVDSSLPSFSMVARALLRAGLDESAQKRSSQTENDRPKWNLLAAKSCLYLGRGCSQAMNHDPKQGLLVNVLQDRQLNHSSGEGALEIKIDHAQDRYRIERLHRK